MSIATLNLGWFLVLLLLGQWLGQAQTRRALDSGASHQTNTLTIVWNPSPSESVTGYALYWGLSSDSCTNRLLLRNVTNVTLVGFKPKATYHFAVAAYDSAGEESPWSNPLQYSLTPGMAPTPAATHLLRLQQINLTGTNPLLRLSFVGQAGGRYQLQATEDLQHWDVLYTTNCPQRQRVTYDFPTTAPCRFFRLLPE